LQILPLESLAYDYAETIGAVVRNVVTISPYESASLGASRELQTSQALEFVGKSSASKVQLTLSEGLVLAVEAGEANLESHIVAVAVESGTDVGAVPAVVVSEEITVAIVESFVPDSELFVRHEDED
jgi:hypothetical protein